MSSYKKQKGMALQKECIEKAKRPNPYNNYVALLCDIIDKEPSTYEEDAEKKEWKDAMIEEYQLMIKYDVWEIVLKLEKKFVVSLK